MMKIKSTVILIIKKSFTGKLFLDITPVGFICLKSTLAGGRKSDSQMTIESGLIDLLKDGHVVLTGKGFPEIKRTINEKSKKVTLVLPPFFANEFKFSKEEIEETHKIARVR